ncbi:exopolysaccharide Pel transporter PelG [Vibrio sp. 947]|uniref:exopolysaccharide Pel transporter PelG n=1 Tax=Vibrio TaxID=662 RepID=UPI001CDB4CDF|nr:MULTISPECIES: exopolysaccharide Pel transporter PelG [Vibrio]MCA2422597.1 exopolysaccharide Pel transporter PelG [Vibrio alginolyticus]MCA2447242.1 exopolysaccharide Pel transporter PelG [Vibrio alginolyticus]MDW1929380.1 exopolysaccharide Pel transporter PelG [Vibrio sp. 947]MDW1948096.1 exopolysaccharide Pel transporter PelG [Vibrio sp. 812(2023)]MDW1990889.1 exopolysaccharide Pel transporter PelG [Vibrio sp. 780]
MAGIGFEIRKILQKNTLLSIIEAYGLAGIISSGPWILTILAMLVIGLVTLGMSFPTEVVIQFLVIVTYLMAGSLIISGLLQLLITRYISDLVSIGQEHRILPNLLGAMLIISVLAAAVGAAVLNLAGTLEPTLKIVIFTTLILLSNQWLAIILLSGMKKYYRILITMAISYGLMLGLSFSLPPSGLLGLMLIFCFCQGILTFAFLYDIIREFPAERLISFEFLNPQKTFYSLIFCGVLYNLGVWLDKFVFWFNTGTSHQVIDVFRASYIYDLPIFIAYLAVVPGMAVFMLHMETEFADACIRFYHAVRKGATLTKIHSLKNNMVVACQKSLYEIFKVQGMTLLLLILWAEDILNLLNIDLTYLHLFYIDLVGVSLQVLFMAILNVMYYLDKRMSALWLILLMAIGNVTLSAITIILGPIFYGYGFAITMFIVSVIGMITLDKQFEDLEYQTFMLQRP